MKKFLLSTLALSMLTAGTAICALPDSNLYSQQFIATYKTLPANITNAKPFILSYVGTTQQFINLEGSLMPGSSLTRVGTYPRGLVEVVPGLYLQSKSGTVYNAYCRQIPLLPFNPANLKITMSNLSNSEPYQVDCSYN